MAGLELSTITTIVYASTNGIVFLITSIYCLWELRQEYYEKQSKIQQENGQIEEKKADHENRRIEENQIKPSTQPQSEDTAATLETETKPPLKDIAGIQGDGTKDHEEEEKKEREADIESSNDKAADSKAHVHEGNFFKDWCLSMWHKKKIYWAVVPHVFDQATDLGTILVYYEAWKDYQKLSDEEREDRAVNPFWFFMFGLIIIAFQRIVSSVTIYFMTHNIKAALLQFIDLLIVKAIWVNYKLNLDEPCNPQRYIELLEAIFESSPQVLLSMGWIMKSSLDGVPISPIIVVSTLFSLWSLTSKVAADDKLILYENGDYYKKFRSIDFKFTKEFPFIRFNFLYLVRVILWRFFEITDRINLCLLIWINIGGLPLLIILGFELICCFICCIVEKSPDAMGNIMYISFSFREKGWVRYFWLYKFVTFYIYLIMVTIFATLDFDEPFVPDPSERAITLHTKTGLSMLVYTWITAFMWPYVLFILSFSEDIEMIDVDVFDISDPDFKAEYGGSTSRDVISYIQNQHFAEASQLLKFGYIVPDDYVDNDGYTLLSVAVRQAEINQDLLSDCYNANPSVIEEGDEDNWTPLYWAARHQLWKVKFLVEKGANINCVTNDGSTPILRAADHGRANVVQYLLEKGADTQIKTDNGTTLLDFCKEHAKVDGFADIIKLLEKDKDRFADSIDLLEKASGDVDNSEENENLIEIEIGK